MTVTAGCNPAPLTATTALAPCALEIVISPVTLSELLGANVTFKVAFCPGVRVRGVVIPLTCTSVALTVICDSVTLEFPVLLTVTLFELELPAFRLPKERLVGLAVRVTVFATPLPFRETVDGEPGALLAIETVPV